MINVTWHMSYCVQKSASYYPLLMSFPGSPFIPFVPFRPGSPCNTHKRYYDGISNPGIYHWSRLATLSRRTRWPVHSFKPRRTSRSIHTRVTHLAHWTRRSISSCSSVVPGRTGVSLRTYWTLYTICNKKLQSLCACFLVQGTKTATNWISVVNEAIKS